MTTQEKEQHLDSLVQAIEKTFASYGWKGGVSYEKAGQHLVTIRVKLPKQTENAKKD
ncbi:MAG: hypothetical protein Q4C04_01465 [Clostridia bacterium]|nr:hypothetical protein [Clostridia bacterium]